MDEPLTLAGLLAEAETRIERLAPEAAHAAAAAGALLVDTRSSDARARDGVVPGALHVPRTVLEWRFAPDSEWRSPHAGDLGRRVVVLCDHGCSSVLAAASLARLGYARVGDVIGGFEAWRAAGLPVGVAPPVDPWSVPGLGDPDPSEGSAL